MRRATQPRRRRPSWPQRARGLPSFRTSSALYYGVCSLPEVWRHRRNASARRSQSRPSGNTIRIPCCKTSIGGGHSLARTGRCVSSLSAFGVGHMFFSRRSLAQFTRILQSQSRPRICASLSHPMLLTMQLHCMAVTTMIVLLGVCDGNSRRTCNSNSANLIVSDAAVHAEQPLPVHQRRLGDEHGDRGH